MKIIYNPVIYHILYNRIIIIKMNILLIRQEGIILLNKINKDIYQISKLIRRKKILILLIMFKKVILLRKVNLIKKKLFPKKNLKMKTMLAFQEAINFIIKVQIITRNKIIKTLTYHNKTFINNLNKFKRNNNYFHMIINKFRIKKNIIEII